MDTEKIRKPHTMNPKSLANLVPIKKGERRNPYGRPTKEKSVTECLRRLMKTPAADGKTKEQLLAEVWYTKALTEAKYFEMLLDRLEGKVTQPIGADGPITFRVIYERVWDKTTGATPGTS